MLVIGDTNSTLAGALVRPAALLWFGLATMMWCVFTVQDSVLAGLKQTLWIPLENTIFAIAKIVLLVVFATTPFVAMGIFASWTLPGFLVVAPITYLLFQRLIPRHMARDVAVGAAPLGVGRIVRYSASNYAGSLLSLLVTTVTPLMVVQQLGPSANAYFAQPWLIAASLQMVAGNMAMSLTVEAASDQGRLQSYARQAVAHTLRLIVPLVAVVLVGAPYLLAIFGTDYAAAGTPLLRVLALGTIPNVLTMLYLGVARVQDRNRTIMGIQGVLCVVTLTLSHFLLPHYGILGIGWAWLTAQTIMALAIMSIFFRPLRRR